ncbi:MAG: DNA translocase FtsK [Acidimicrobiia bacterium]|nr:DNA translocase FtsK [Acidimicrobiia bacterium]
MFRSAFEGHVADAWGLALIAIGILAGLGIYADLAGAAGRFLETASGGMVGVARFLVPPALVLAGTLLIRSDPNAEDGNVPVRGIVGSLFLLVGGTGLLHLALGRPAIGDGLDALGDAGGFAGAATGVPLEAFASVWGATLVLGTVTAIGLLVLTQTTVRAVAGTTAAGFRPVGHAGRQAFSTLFSGPEPSGSHTLDLTSAGPDPTTTLERPASDDAPTIVVGGRSIDPSDPVPPFDQDTADAAKKAPKRKTEATLVPDEVVADPQQLHIDLGPAANASPWRLPKMDVLRKSAPHAVDHKAVEETGRVLERALAEHGVETRLVGMVVGPTVTRYELELGPGVKVARVTSLHKDIAYAMASPDVRILAPIPGRQAIGVEVPNAKREIVALGDLLASPEAKRATHPLEVAMGRDINGTSVMLNLAAMPHVLIAGATGAGKSSCINSIITSILMRATPDQVRLILVDPKRVELTQYAKLPHLLTEVVVDPKKAANALDWAVREMDRRYEVLEAVGVRDITGYNNAYDRGDLREAPGAGEVDHDGEPLEYPRMSFIVIVVDELNDLMMVAARDVEASICRIAQKARAVGIHLVLATQRPSVNVITGLIKANVPSRIAFAVSSLADSRVVLDQGGAERLIGKGDMLMLTATSSTAQRVQGAWVTEEEVRDVAKAWRKQAPEITYNTEVQGAAEGAGAAAQLPGGTTGDEDDDELLVQAMDLIVRSQLGSTSMLQRKLRVGFARAGRLMDLLEQRGVVGPSEGSKARVVLMTLAELDGAAPTADDLLGPDHLPDEF